MKSLPSFWTSVYDTLNTEELRNLYRELRSVATMGHTLEFVRLFDDSVMRGARSEVAIQGCPMSLETQAISQAVLYAVQSLAVAHFVAASEETLHAGGFLGGDVHTDATHATRIVLDILNRYL